MKPVVMIGSLGLDAVHIALIAGVLALAVGLYIIWSRNGEQMRRLTRELEFAEEEMDGLRDERDNAHELAEAKALQAEEAKIALAKVETQSAEQEKRFAELAQGAVRAAHSQFLERADERFEKLVEPIAKNFSEFKQRVELIEKVRTEDKTLLQEQVKAIGESLHRNTAETGKLVNALTAPKGGGRWGEMTLRNVMEQAGLSAHCDFNEQVTDQTEAGTQRPDAIIHLPGGRQIVVDSKVSLEAYMSANAADDPDAASAFLKSHANAVQRHVNTLASKDYQSNLGNRFDYIAMFIPGENFFAAALEHAPDLIEKAMAKKVIVTTPTTLIALARTVAHLWRQHEMNENAMEAAALGAELYTRTATLLGHMDKLGKSLNGSAEHYNKMMASFDKRVLPAMRKFEQLSIAPPDKALPEPKKVEVQADVPDGPSLLDLTG